MRRGKAKVCGECPKRERYGVCVIRAKFMVFDHPACDYGLRAIRNEIAKRLARIRRGQSADGSQTKIYTPRGWKVKTQKTKTRKGSRYEDQDQ